ncbi:MAG: peptidase [Gemmatimonadetes bacterium]|nr:peptidase [Gemmatimonadota bacterium]
MFEDAIATILKQAASEPDNAENAGSAGKEIGRSREDRPLYAHTFGSGPLLVSLLAGCHADEPTGPALLARLVSHLDSLPANDPMLRRVTWAIVPDANPDGAARNRAWFEGAGDSYDLPAYLEHVQRDLPADDLEFGFPIEGEHGAKRPENAAIHAFWKSFDRPFDLHASLHSLGIGYGPWFLVEESWRGRLTLLYRACADAVHALGYRLHDIDRAGEKGFRRVAPGFSTRPDSRAMRAHFLKAKDEDGAAHFHPSSMESIRALPGGTDADREPGRTGDSVGSIDPAGTLTLVTEMPNFLLPPENVPQILTWPDPALDAFRARLAFWMLRLSGEERTRKEALREIEASGIRPMPIADQMRLQWTFVCAGLDAVTRLPDS